ncbi:NAD-dependent epimerase/dehydratase family protein [Methylobacterium mesophilicum SR1.6/6]|uniref:NAD-dependent epimerase/dehydratase family protein n=1 Tax=Methylobacterium mesophilicum SR1.6/6 TaxID=908290 RepID=A0A6B9FRM8_9HYPH|nr:GMC oxidoreductase [Methylobacterium mesophilicum]QGY04692.1 NAD-dependent epimerase/dehydratase family protein [Methylobacterium mesophilicum SR1.6/6]
MRIIDLRTAGGQATAAVEGSDVCIVGSGPAGSTIARELTRSGLRVTMLESGSHERQSDADALDEVENIGRARLSVDDQWHVRNRIIGGSSHTWGGRCAAFDEIDFEHRPWVPASGWPFRREILVPFLERSAEYLGLVSGEGFSDDRFWRLANRQAPAAPDPRLLLPFFWQFSRDGEHAYRFEYMRFGPRIDDRLGPNFTLLTNATVIRIDPVESGKAVSSVIVAAPDGQRFTIPARTVVLCAGGIENPRLLLSSDSVVKGGLGNDRDLVGRYLMDHPRGSIASFPVESSREVERRFGRFTVRGNLFRAGLRLSPQLQREEGLLNVAAWLGEEVAPGDPLEALKRIASGRAKLSEDVGVLAASPGLLVRGLHQYFVQANGFPRKLSSLTLDAMCEQRPDPDSRITLSDRRDRFGSRLPRIDWRVHPDEERSMRRMAEVARDSFAAMGLPVPELEPWVRHQAPFPDSITDVGHPTGATRMADDPTMGVVDADHQVHGVDGLYVAGSSTFPTAGHANPTQMIVATSLRLADGLKARVRSARPPAICTSPAGEQNPIRVLLTGATGRIGRVVLADLAARGYRVRATTSKSLPLDSRAPGLEWRHFDLLRQDGYDALVEGCDAILHIAAEMHDPARMPQANVEATRLLAAAGERAQVRTFVYTSSVAVYGSGRGRIMSEDAPVLTADRDVPNEYWAIDQTRAYGRTKLAGELALAAEARLTRYVALRPTVVVGLPELIEIRDWPRSKRVIAAHRHAHHVYVGDVSDAILWAMERGLSGVGPAGSFETFNVGEDHFATPTHADFMLKAYDATGDLRFKVPPVPPAVDWVRDFARFRRLPLRNPLWRMRFPANKIAAAGWSPPFGMAWAHAEALRLLRVEAACEALPQQGAKPR